MFILYHHFSFYCYFNSPPLSRASHPNFHIHNSDHSFFFPRSCILSIHHPRPGHPHKATHHNLLSILPTSSKTFTPFYPSSEFFLLPCCLLKLCELSISKTSSKLSPALWSFLPFSGPFGGRLWCPPAAVGLCFSSHQARIQALRPQAVSLPVHMPFSLQSSSPVTVFNSSSISQKSWFPFHGTFLLLPLSCWHLAFIVYSGVFCLCLHRGIFHILVLSPLPFALNTLRFSTFLYF